MISYNSFHFHHLGSPVENTIYDALFHNAVQLRCLRKSMTHGAFFSKKDGTTSFRQNPLKHTCAEREAHRLDLDFITKQPI